MHKLRDWWKKNIEKDVKLISVFFLIFVDFYFFSKFVSTQSQTLGIDWLIYCLLDQFTNSLIYWYWITTPPRKCQAHHRGRAYHHRNLRAVDGGSGRCGQLPPARDRHGTRRRAKDFPVVWRPDGDGDQSDPRHALSSGALLAFWWRGDTIRYWDGQNM